MEGKEILAFSRGDFIKLYYRHVRNFSLVLIVTTISILAACAGMPHRQPKILGSVSGNTYTSPTGLFKVEIPVMTNPFVKTPLISDVSMKEPLIFEEVAFVVPDFGEAYIIGIRQIPDEVLSHMEEADHRETVLQSMADQTLLDWRPLPHEPNLFDDKFMETRFGEGLVRIYLAPEGSLLVSAQGRKPRADDTFDTLIAVLVVKKEGLHLFAIAEFDDMMNGLTGLHAPEDNLPISSRLTEQIIHLFGSLIITRS